MKVLVVIPSKMTKIGTIASCKIARYLADKFNCELYGTDVETKPMTVDPDLILYVGYPPVFAPMWWHHNVVELINKGIPFIYIQNDYSANCEPTSLINTSRGKLGLPRFNRSNTVVWTNMPYKMVAPGSCYVNWNMLTYTKPLFNCEPDEVALCYWGAPRTDRMKYFKRYLSDTSYKSVFSTTNPGRRKLQESTINPTEFIPPFQDIQDMRKYSHCLYIEDEYTHTHYNSPANRFYEALSLGRTILFDRNCVKTFDEDGYNIRDFVVSNKGEVEHWLARYEGQHGMQDHWHRDYRAELNTQVDAAMLTATSLVVK